MKFKHGLIAGFIGGFAFVCSVIAARELDQEREFKAKQVDFEHEGYSKGFTDGKKFFRDFHEIHHVGCDRCPH
jgi:hypothetical protein